MVNVSYNFILLYWTWICMIKFQNCVGTKLFCNRGEKSNVPMNNAISEANSRELWVIKVCMVLSLSMANTKLRYINTFWKFFSIKSTSQTAVIVISNKILPHLPWDTLMLSFNFWQGFAMFSFSHQRNQMQMSPISLTF